MTCKSLSAQRRPSTIKSIKCRWRRDRRNSSLSSSSTSWWRISTTRTRNARNVLNLYRSRSSTSKRPLRRDLVEQKDKLTSLRWLPMKVKIKMRLRKEQTCWCKKLGQHSSRNAWNEKCRSIKQSSLHSKRSEHPPATPMSRRWYRNSWPKSRRMRIFSKLWVKERRSMMNWNN